MQKLDDLLGKFSYGPYRQALDSIRNEELRLRFARHFAEHADDSTLKSIVLSTGFNVPGDCKIEGKTATSEATGESYSLVWQAGDFSTTYRRGIKLLYKSNNPSSHGFCFVGGHGATTGLVNIRSFLINGFPMIAGPGCFEKMLELTDIAASVEIEEVPAQPYRELAAKMEEGEEQPVTSFVADRLLEYLIITQSERDRQWEEVKAQLMDKLEARQLEMLEQRKEQLDMLIAAGEGDAAYRFAHYLMQQKGSFFNRLLRNIGENISNQVDILRHGIPDPNAVSQLQFWALAYLAMSKEVFFGNTAHDLAGYLDEIKERLHQPGMEPYLALLEQKKISEQATLADILGGIQLFKEDEYRIRRSHLGNEFRKYYTNPAEFFQELERLVQRSFSEYRRGEYGAVKEFHSLTMGPFDVFDNMARQCYVSWFKENFPKAIVNVRKQRMVEAGLKPNLKGKFSATEEYGLSNEPGDLANRVEYGVMEEDGFMARLRTHLEEIRYGLVAKAIEEEAKEHSPLLNSLTELTEGIRRTVRDIYADSETYLRLIVPEEDKALLKRVLAQARVFVTRDFLSRIERYRLALAAKHAALDGYYVAGSKEVVERSLLLGKHVTVTLEDMASGDALIIDEAEGYKAQRLERNKFRIFAGNVYPLLEKAQTIDSKARLRIDEGDYSRVIAHDSRNRYDWVSRQVIAQQLLPERQPRFRIEIKRGYVTDKELFKQQMEFMRRLKTRHGLLGDLKSGLYTSDSHIWHINQVAREIYESGYDNIKISFTPRTSRG